MMKQWLNQILAVVRLELRKTFFARRGFWVYWLAFAPLLLFVAAALLGPQRENRLARIAKEHPCSITALRAIRIGFTAEEVVAKLGEPYAQMHGLHLRTEGVRGDLIYRYTDGKTDFTFLFAKGQVKHISTIEPDSLDKGSIIFATTFQTYFLRLAIFFGCVGVFTNLIRGEMLDKSLHFYLLTPMRREVLLAGKYFAGLLATVVIFTTSAGLQYLAMLWRFDHSIIAEYFAGPGWKEVFSYLAVTMLACVGYGSVFLAAGMFFRNPIIPTAIVLLWEGANVFLPAALKKISLIFYLQSLCPVVDLPDEKMPAVWRLLISTTDPVAPAIAVTGILVFTFVVLVSAAFRARKLEINYNAD